MFPFKYDWIVNEHKISTPNHPCFFSLLYLFILPVDLRKRLTGKKRFLKPKAKEARIPSSRWWRERRERQASFDHFVLCTYPFTLLLGSNSVFKIFRLLFQTESRCKYIGFLLLHNSITQWFPVKAQTPLVDIIRFDLLRIVVILTV